MKKEKSQILVSTLPHCMRIIHMKDNSIISFVHHNQNKQIQSGSIYQGKIIKVIPTMASCFVDIGTEQSGFLYLNEPTEDGASKETLKNEQSLMVQITKEPLGSKGARLSSQINLIGPYLIYMPQSSGVRISKKINLEKERERLTKCIESLNPLGGIIVRSKAKGRKDFKNDLDQLVSLWTKIQKKKRKSPGLIHAEPGPELQILRDDLLYPQSTKVWIDDQKTYENALSFVKEFMPEFESKISYYNKKEPLFEKFKVEKKIKNALKRKVYLKSGGSIVIDENEALVSIDVNTSKFIGKKSQDENILKINLEAVKEVAEQIRIRNCGGIIVIDLIDMKDEKSKEQVMELLEKELEKDRAQTQIISISDLNIIQMTRHRKRPSLKATLCQPCEFCHGYGWILSPEALLCDFLMEIQKKYKASKKGQTLLLKGHPRVVHWFKEQQAAISFLKQHYGIHLKFEEDPQIEKFKYVEISKRKS